MPENAKPAMGLDRLPTLTEVLELGPRPAPTEATPVPVPDPSPTFDLAWPDPVPAAGALPVPVPVPVAPVEPADAQPTVQPVPQPLAATVIGSIDARALVLQVLADVQPLLDESLEARLQQALAPALARAADGLIRDLRQELAGTLRDLVDEAVARALRARRHPN